MAITFGCEWCASPKPFSSVVTNSGVSFPSLVGISFSAQPVNLVGAPHSSTAICAVDAQMMLWNEETQACKAITLAPVPLNTKYGMIDSFSNNVFIAFSALCVQLSSPYPMAWLVLLSIMASMMRGCTPELLSLPKLLISLLN